jgi:hypothetical protein
MVFRGPDGSAAGSGQSDGASGRSSPQKEGIGKKATP